MGDLAKLTWVSRLILTTEEEDALVSRILPIIRAMKLTPDQEFCEKNNLHRSFIDCTRDGLRKFLKVYLYVSALGLSVRQALSVAKKLLKTQKITTVDVRVIKQFAMFSSLVVSSRPLFKEILKKNSNKGENNVKCTKDFAANLLASAIAVSFYPKTLLLETASLWYLFFGIEYSYRLFEHRILQLNNLNDEISDTGDNTPLSQKLYTFLSRKSWLFFPISSSIFWKNFIQEPTRAHELPSKIFNSVGEELKFTDVGDNLVTLLRINLPLRKSLQNVKWSQLIRQVPSSYLVALKLSSLMIAFKMLLQHDNLRKSLKNLSLYEVLKKYVKETLKLSTLIGGVPLIAFLLTTFVLQFAVIGPNSLRLIGFISGLVTVIYRGRKRMPEEKDIKIETTNRAAWLTMLRETLIASIAGQPSAGIVSKVAFLFGLATLFCIYDLEADSKEDDAVFSDAKFLRYLKKISG